MNYGLSAVLAITVVSSLYGAQLKLFNTVNDQVNRMENLMNAAVAEANSIAPGYDEFLQDANDRVGNMQETVAELNR